MLGTFLGAAALFTVGYNTMAPRSQLYGRTFIGDKRRELELALTFDDGPNDPYTQRLLELLASQNVKATFFVIGSFVRQRPDIVRSIAQAGHAVGNHTYTHPNLIFRGMKAIREEIADCEAAIEDALGEPSSKLFRPPWGARTPWSLRAIRYAGYSPIMWSATGYDWLDKTAGQIASKVASQVTGGDVILLHDGSYKAFGTDRTATLGATGLLIRRFGDGGFHFRTVPELMRQAESLGAAV